MTAVTNQGQAGRGFLRQFWVLLGLGGVGLLLSASQPWWRIVTDTGSPTLSGTETAGGIGQALGALALIGVVLSWTLRRTGRRVLGVLLALAGATAVLVGARPPRPSDQTVVDRLRETSLADVWTLQSTGWSWAFVGCGLLVLSGAVVMLLAPPPSRAQRFERSADHDPEPADWWKSLDAGHDPTQAGTRFPTDEGGARE